MSTVSISKLVREEPWRAGQGRPRNILQPGWVKEPTACTGEIEYEAGTKWWWCKACGHCSCLHMHTHYKPVHPSDYYKDSLNYFYQERERQGVSKALAEQQAQHVMGVALRMAASLHPEELAKYVDEYVLLS